MDEGALRSLAVERLRTLIRELSPLDQHGGYDGWYVAYQALMDTSLRIDERPGRPA